MEKFGYNYSKCINLRITNLAVVELNHTFTSVVVFPFYSCFAYGPPVDSNLSISSVLPDNSDFGFTTAFFNQIAPLFELQSSGL